MRPLWILLASLLLLSCVVGDELSPFSDDPPVDDTVDDEGEEGRSLAFYYGPMKPMYAESILYTIAAITGHDFGGFDFTAPDPAATAFTDSGNASNVFYLRCRRLGGCMEHRIPLGRTSFIGTAYVLELDRAASEACYNSAAFGMFPGNVAPGASVQALDIIEHQYIRAFGEKPSTEDLASSLEYFTAHLEDPAEQGLESAGRGHCRTLLTTNRFLFY